MMQRARRDEVLVVHNASDVIVDDVIAADGGEYPRMTSSNITGRHSQRPTRISLVHTLLFI